MKIFYLILTIVFAFFIVTFSQFNAAPVTIKYYYLQDLVVPAYMLIFVALLVGVVIGIASDYFTNDEKKPVRNVAKASESGPAFTTLSGVSYRFLSALPPLVGIALSSLVAYKLCEPIGEGYDRFGIAMAAVGMLSIVGMIISNDAYGPIVDNARGLAEMGGLGEETIRVADELDSAGNTVKAVTKGFAIGAPALTAIAQLRALMTEVKTVLA